MPPRASKAAADAAGEGQPGASANNINGVIPTASEVKFIFAFIGNLKSKPDVNWEELAATMGLAGKKSAYERWRLMRIKFGITLSEEGEAAAPGSARKGKKTAAAKAAKNDNDDDNDDETGDGNGAEPKSAPATPAKRGRKPASAAGTPASAAGKKRAAAAAAAAAIAADAGGGSSPADDEDMGSPTKKVKGKAAAAVEEDSPLSSVPGMTADEDSGNEMAV
ncbi:uncharacterized protein B0H64DRAFT_444559 [Chaetomium fimeti]|uniref:Uncharacterized protein n=1 Tax=Chaetomium fimeti TaxID=1854472 RepID=A0AAE0HB23_9PEZI|nr:hypothetical protein B0H64DRAFT_444559 [Chaetomium fimeti]